MTIITPFGVLPLPRSETSSIGQASQSDVGSTAQQSGAAQTVTLPDTQDVSPGTVYPDAEPKTPNEEYGIPYTPTNAAKAVIFEAKASEDENIIEVDFTEKTYRALAEDVGANLASGVAFESPRLDRLLESNQPGVLAVIDAEVRFSQGANPVHAVYESARLTSVAAETVNKSV